MYVHPLPKSHQPSKERDRDRDRYRVQEHQDLHNPRRIDVPRRPVGNEDSGFRHIDIHGFPKPNDFDRELRDEKRKEELMRQYFANQGQ